MDASDYMYLSIIVVFIIGAIALIYINIKIKKIKTKAIDDDIQDTNDLIVTLNKPEKKIDKINLILIAGGSGSGKTTLSKQIMNECKLKGLDVSLIRMDFYYKTASTFGNEEIKNINWDTPKAVDISRLKKDITKLKNGFKVINYNYNFEKGEYYKDEKITIEPSKFIILEGIFSLYDKDINKEAYRKYYIHSNPEIRYKRRLERDKKERFSSLDDDNFRKNWEEKILPMHKKYIEPTKMDANFIIVNNDLKNKKQINEISKILVKSWKNK